MNQGEFTLKSPTLRFIRRVTDNLGETQNLCSANANIKAYMNGSSVIFNTERYLKEMISPFNFGEFLLKMKLD